MKYSTYSEVQYQTKQCIDNTCISLDTNLHFLQNVIFTKSTKVGTHKFELLVNNSIILNKVGDCL